MSSTNGLIPLTDHRGEPLLGRVGLREPLPGSVVLTEGVHGTAWQRFFSDGLWHSARGGRPQAWWQLLDKRNLVLVYDAEQRADQSYADAALRKAGA